MFSEPVTSKCTIVRWIKKTNYEIEDMFLVDMESFNWNSFYLIPFNLSHSTKKWKVFEFLFKFSI